MATVDVTRIVHAAQHTQNLRIRYAAFLKEVQQLAVTTSVDYPIDDIVRKLDEVACSTWANALGNQRIMSAADVLQVRRDVSHINYLIETGGMHNTSVFNVAVAVEKARIMHLFEKAVRKAVA